MIQELDDYQFIKKIKKGDVSSFDAIFRKYHKKIYYFAISYLKNKEEAEDVVQEVFMNLWKCREQISEYYVFSSYLFKVTYNTTCKRFRKKASDMKHQEEALKDFTIGDDSLNLDMEYNNLLESAKLQISKLPSRQRNILLLSILDGLSNEEIAAKLEISKKTVDNYLSMAKATIRKLLTDGGILSALFIGLFL